MLNRNIDNVMVAVKLVAYLVMEKVSSMTRMTLQQVKNHAK